MSPPSFVSGPMRTPPHLRKAVAPEANSTVSRRRAVVTRAALSGCSATVLLVLLMSAAHVASFGSPDETRAAALATFALNAIDVTSVLTVVAVLSVVALLRKLPYGIGAVIACTIGAVLTAELARERFESTMAPTDLPSGQLVAMAALLGAASMVASTAWRPAVLGLGTTGTLAVAASAWVVGSASVVGITISLMIVFVWWPACSIVMLYSPDAIAREARNPFDTAAMAVQRKMGRSR